MLKNRLDGEKTEGAGKWGWKEIELRYHDGLLEPTKYNRSHDHGSRLATMGFTSRCSSSC